jgi:undecaprenyl-diphosphatase
MAGWDNPDVEMLYDVNGLAKEAPGWVDHTMALVGEYGIIAALAVLILWGWASSRRRSPDGEAAAVSLAGLVWAPLAAGVALLVNIPVRELVERPRPFVDHKGLDVLVSGKNDFSFVSDHATLTMALAVGLFMVHRRLGLAGIALAVLEGFCRVYMGVHYPTDVLGGLALGTAVTLLLAPAALAALTPVARRAADSRLLGRLVWVGPSVSADGPSDDGARKRASGPAAERPPACYDGDLAA